MNDALKGIAALKRKNGAQKASAGISRRTAKVEQTRQRILSAAREVFTRYPFRTAGIRMIGEAGGFNHSFIRYHFSTKASLFEEVVRELHEEYLELSKVIIKDMGHKALHEDLSVAMDRLLDFGSKKPDILKLMMLNIGETDSIEEMSGGIQYIRKYSEIVHAMFIRNKAFRASRREVTMWIWAFTIMIANYMGSPSIFRQALGLTGDESGYRRFVKDSLMLIFYPPLKALLFPESYTIHRSPVKSRRKKQTKGKSNSGDAGGELPRTAKGDMTRMRILEVARSIFARNPFNSASIRMIGEAGDFDFTLLYHYFPTKADLFEAVAGELYAELTCFEKYFVQELKNESLQNVLSFAINSHVDYYSEKREGLMICMQNIAQIDTLEDTPGARHLINIITDTQEKYRLPDKKANREMRAILYGLGIILINCLGASTFHASILGMDPQSPGYKRWVKDMLMFIFYPSFQEHIARWKEFHATNSKIKYYPGD